MVSFVDTQTGLELTAQRFVPNVFDEKSGAPYRTGDLVRYRPDGNVNSGAIRSSGQDPVSHRNRLGRDGDDQHPL
jgi:hypothetical protein